MDQRPRHYLLDLTALAAFLVLAAIALSVPLSRPQAAGLFGEAEAGRRSFPNYDIRIDAAKKDVISGFRRTSGRSAEDVEAVRRGFAAGEERLRAEVPALKVDANEDLRIPEVIATNPVSGPAFLTAPPAASGKRSDLLIHFLKANSSLIGQTDQQIDGLVVAADYTNPDGDLSFVELNQVINGIPVFRGEVKAGFTRRGELIRVINNLAPGIDGASVSDDFGDEGRAVEFARQYCDPTSATAKAEKMYFPTEPGVVIPAWRVAVVGPRAAFYVIVDANSGELLWRKTLTDDQTQPASYGIYANPNAMVNVADSPFPLTPGPTSPNGQQGPALTRSLISRVGNEPPYSFNNLGWMTDGTNETDGNNVEAGLDRDTTDGVDAVNGRAQGTSRVFNFSYSPGDPNTDSGESPIPAGEVISPCSAIVQPHGFSEYQKGVVTQLFYTVNWFHDETYRLGFTEAARNFQHDNFSRGGVAGDRVSAEAQDCTGTGNANFSTLADGQRGRMQMYIFTGPNPDFDGDLDASVVFHEATHGLSNRLHGNASGLTNNMSRGMGEGFSDFYALSLLSEPSDPVNGVYTVGGYITYRAFAGYVSNYYYGIRRFPQAVRAFTGGPNARPHNPLTFADIDQSQLDISDGAYPRGTYGSTNADQVHNAGEIWSAALWEVRARLIARLGWAAGNRKALQIVTDGMKLAPLAPTFISERDAILAAAQASALSPQASLDVQDVWAGFAARGLGISASIQANGSGQGDARVTEAFDLPNLLQTPELTVTDSNNGYPDPGENVVLNIPVTNPTGVAATNVTVQVAGGGQGNYGTIQSGQTVSVGVPYQVPSSAVCGGIVTLTITVNSSLGPAVFTRQISTGNPIQTFAESFDTVAAPSLPSGWTASPVLSGINFANTTASPDTAPNSMFAAGLTSGGGGTDLTSPPMAISSQSANVSFRQNYLTEAGWDGGVLEISMNGGAYQDILAAGGTFLSNGYNLTLGNSTNNPLSNRRAWSGSSSGYITTTARLPAAAAGTTVTLRWRFGADNNTPAVGWYVDTVRVFGQSLCIIVDNFPKARADFDGDNRTDLSVFRPSEGNWYLDRSSSGFTGVHFGDAADIPTPGDYDGDGKTDIAVWRPSSGVWFVLKSSSNQLSVTSFGTNGDVPAARDFDGDGREDVTVWRPSTGVWYWLSSGNGGFNALQFGQNGDLPVPGDYDGDGKADIAVYRPSNGGWYRLNSSNGGFFAVGFGLATDRPVPADYDGDNKEDICVFRPSNGVWYRLSPQGQLSVVQFGSSGDVPVPGDYDGDGRDDQAVFRGGVWYLNRSAVGFAAAQFGVAADAPIPSKYFP